MNLKRLSAIAEITSSVAVLVTLVYLTIQIQQNTQVLEAGSRQAQYQAGAMDEASWLDVRGSLVAEMSTLQGRKWWNFFSPEFETRFRDHVNEQLKDQPILTALPDIRAFD